MEATSFPSSVQSAPPPVANALPASSDGAVIASTSRSPFAEVMRQALATSQTRSARQSNAPTDNHAAATKVPRSSGSEKEQHRSQDSPTDPASTNPISMALPNISLPPLTLTPNLGLNADAQNAGSTGGPINLPLVSQQMSTPACVAPPLAAVSSVPTMPVILTAAVDTVISAAVPATAGVSPDIQVPLQTGLSQETQLPLQTPPIPQPRQTLRTLQIPETPQIPLTASLPASGGSDTTSIIANTPATPAIASAVASNPRPDGAASGLPVKATSWQQSLPVAQGTVPILPSPPEVAVTANVAVSAEQAATWKGIAKAAIVTAVHPSPLSATGTKDAPNPANFPPATATPQEQKLPVIAHSDSQKSGSNQNDGQFRETLNSANATPSVTPGHDVPQFASLLSSPPQTKPDAVQMNSSAAVAIPSSALPSDRPTGTATAPATDAPPSSHLPLASNQPDSASGKFVSGAQLLAGAGHSEMRISLDTDKLGSIELRARLSGDQVGAAIVVEKREAHAALALELPALQQALSDKQLRVDQVSLLHGTFNATTGDAGASAKQDQPHAPRGSLGSPLIESNLSGQLLVSTAQSGIFDSQGHLSVHA